MTRGKRERTVRIDGGTLWMSGGFRQPPYRSYPSPPDRLEQLAARCGMSDEDLRTLLEREVARRRSERKKS